MSTFFKLKPEKIKYVTEIKTLDETHKKIANSFQQNKEKLPQKKKKLKRLQNKFEKLNMKDASEYTTEDIKLKSKLKSEIKILGEEIYDIENDITEIEYYSKIDELLMDYYDVLDNEEDVYYQENPELSKINNNSTQKQELDALDILNMKNKKLRKQKKTTRKRKRKNVDNQSKDIMDFFGCKKEDKETNDEDNEKLKDRSQLLDEYRMLIDNEYISEKNKNNSPILRCPECNIDKTLHQSEGLYVCVNCGEGEMVIIESERPNYKDVVPEKPGYPYKRINHFNEFILMNGDLCIILIGISEY